MRLLLSLLLIVLLVTGCASARKEWKEQYEQGRTRAYDDLTKEERKRDKEHWYEWERQYDEFKAREYGK